MPGRIKDARGTPRRPLLTLLRRAALTLLVLLVLLIAGLAWLGGTRTGTRTLFQLAQQIAPAAVQVENIDGRLIGPLQLGRLQLHTASADVTLHDVAIDWSPAQLLQRSLTIPTLRIAKATVRLLPQKKKTPPQLPASLDLPVALHIGHAEIGHADIANEGGSLVTLDPVQFALDFDHRNYQLALDQLGVRTPQAGEPVAAQTHGTLTLASQRPFAITAQLALQATGEAAARPVDSAGTLLLDGSLQDLRSRMDLQVAQPVPATSAADHATAGNKAGTTTGTTPAPTSAPLRVQGEALLHPFSAVPLPLAQADIRLQGLDLRAWQTGLPATHIDGRLTLDQKGRGQLQLSNTRPGTWDHKALPLRSLALDFTQRQQDLTLTNLVAQLGSASQPAGTLRGEGHVRNGIFDLVVHADALDAKRLDARARATRLRGDARVQGDTAGQEITLSLQDSANAPSAGAPLRLELHGRRTPALVRIDRAQLRTGQTLVDLRADIGMQDQETFDVQGSLQRFRLSDFGRFPNLPALALNAEFSARGQRQPALRADVKYRIADSRLNDQPLSGNGDVHVAGDVIDVPRLLLQAGANTLSAQGRLAGDKGKLDVSLDAPHLDQLGLRATGTLHATGKVSGSLARAQIALTWTGAGLRLPLGTGAAPATVSAQNAPAPTQKATSARSARHSTSRAATRATLAAAAPAASGTATRTAALADSAPGLTIGATEGNAHISTDRRLPFGVQAIDLQATARAIAANDRRIGSLTATAQLGTGKASPLQLDVKAEALDAGLAHADAVTLHTDGTNARHTMVAGWQAADQRWTLQASGGLTDLSRAPEWRGMIEKIDGSGLVQAHLKAPAPLMVNARVLAVQALRLDTSLAQVDIDQLRRDGDRLATRGRIDHLQLAKVLAFAGPQPAVTTDLVLGAQWDLRLEDSLSGTARVSREQGDVVMHGGHPVTLGLSALEARADAGNGRVQLHFRGAGQQLGRIDLDLSTALGTGAQRLHPPVDAPLAGTATLDIPSLAWVAPLVSPTAITEGSVRGHADIAGTVGNPRLQGGIDGTQLRVYLTDSGVDLRHGTLHAAFNDSRLLLDSLRFPGGDGELVIAGPVDFAGSQPGMRLSVTARKFQVFNRADRKLVASGAGRIALAEKHLDVSGDFTVDSGFIDIGRLDMPQLSDDVVIVGRTSKKGRGGMAASLDVRIGLPNGVTLKGRGLDALLKGSLRLRNSAPEPLQAEGTLDVAKGTFSAYGRDLKIERGLVRFNGPLNNPGLDILAMRRGLQVEAGVSVGGTVLAPRITLVSEPTVPDAEKLSWLVLGHGLSDTSQGEVGALQSAAGALLQRGAAAGVGSQLASAFGLDTVSLGTSQDSLQERIVTLGKQVSARLYVSYQKGLQSANNALLLRYTLSPRLTVEAEAGAISVLSLFYNVSFD